MKRLLPQVLGVIAIAALSNANVRATAFQKPVHAATSALPVVIAVISDHYTDQDKFNNDVDNFIEYGLLAHDYYADHAAELEIVSFYEPLAAGTQSNFGFDVEVPSQNCVLSWSDDPGPNGTLAKLLAVAGNNPDHIIVIGDHPYNIGCTNGKWTYVGEDAMGTDVLPHEMGHALATLSDEWFFESNRGVSHPGIPDNETRNCFDPRAPGTTPPWLVPSTVALFPGAGSFAGCDFFELNAVHAYDHQYNGHHYCLMGATSGAEFCPVCHRFMEEAFAIRNPDVENPGLTGPAVTNPDVRDPIPPAAPTGLRIVKIGFAQPTPGTTKPTTPGAILKPVPPRPILQLVVSFDPANGRIVAKKGFPITARYVPSQLRRGDWVYEISNPTLKPQNQILEVGVFPSNLFQSNSYQGDAAHQRTAPHVTDVTIQIPDVRNDYAKTGTPELLIRIYQLMPSVTERLITPAVLAKLKASGQAVQRGVELTSKDIRSVM